MGLFMAGLSNIDTIKENNTFKRLYKSKKCFVYPQIVVYAKKNHLGRFRYGITTGKKIGNAVVRSRCRRVIRAALAHYAEPLENTRGGYDVVIVARKKAAFVKSTQLIEPIGDSLRRAGVID